MQVQVIVFNRRILSITPVFVENLMLIRYTKTINILVLCVHVGREDQPSTG